ncbi:MAG: neutral zinc metallopeptidase [Verrucomicrobiota bacterium]
MEWQGRRESGNVEDRRGVGGIPIVGGGLGLLVILVISLLTGADPRALLRLTSEVARDGRTPPPAQTAPTDDRARFVSVVLADTEDVWHEQFTRLQRPYEEPKLVLFSGMVQSACGRASAAVGPFYCPNDAKVYIDLRFYDELQRRFGAPGDFAQAYVIAHEVGHHVQNLLGITKQVDAQRGRASQAQVNLASVRLELQADFLAGVWAHHTQRAKQVLESGDLEEALRAASAIGDDNIQRQAQGYVVPDSFTHGTSAQRVRWFRKGFETGDITQGDTFSVREQDL